MDYGIERFWGHSVLLNFLTHDKRIMKQTYYFNPSKMDKNGSAGFFVTTLYIKVLMHLCINPAPCSAIILLTIDCSEY